MATQLENQKQLSIYKQVTKTKKKKQMDRKAIKKWTSRLIIIIIIINGPITGIK
jgi:hypothetical protein